jgi:AbrB family looped-hinge helix DNA binding protein
MPGFHCYPAVLLPLMSVLALKLDKSLSIVILSNKNIIDRGVIMQTVTVSPKFQVVIPKDIREAMRLRPGQKLKVIEYEGRIELIPDRDISELKGFLKGINTEFERESDRL